MSPSVRAPDRVLRFDPGWAGVVARTSSDGTMGLMTAPLVAPAETPSTAERPAHQRPWVTVVWDDPVNLMSYVTHVFESYFHYAKSKAEKLMMQVHTDGRAIVSDGTREAMERDVTAMHEYGLWATIDKADE